jgi:hypothetical protein
MIRGRQRLRPQSVRTRPPGCRLHRPATRPVRYDPTLSGRTREGGAARRSTAPRAMRWEPNVSSEPPAKFFVNQGLVTSRTDIQHLLRPVLKQTVVYRYLRGRDVVAHGTGWVERIVADRPDVSTFFTPIAITLNVDSFEHLEFETRPDQLLVYTLVQGDERVVIEFVPTGVGEDDGPSAPRQLEFDTSEFVQMELLGLEGNEE